MVDGSVPWLSTTAGYVALHLLTYIFILRHKDFFKKETVIFNYHVFSEILLGFFLAASFFPLSNPEWVALIGALSFHAVYSLTFLELWGLADGGYSLRILNYIYMKKENGVTIREDLKFVGSLKKQDRIESLLRTKMVNLSDKRFKATLRGRLAACPLFLIAWLWNRKP